MTGTEIRNHLLSLKSIKANPSWANLQEPADLTFSKGVQDSVTIQYRRIEAQYNLQDGSFTLSRNTQGQGYWIPYIGNGANQLAGVAATRNRGLGSFAWIPDHIGISWAVTGPFSGCSTASFDHPDGGKIFAHLISPAQGYTAASLVTQKSDIEGYYNTPVGPNPQQVMNNHGLGYVFWVRDAGFWYRQVIFARPNGDEVYNEGEERVP